MPRVETDVTHRLTVAGGPGSVEWEAVTEIERLRLECAEAYRLFGCLAGVTGGCDDGTISRVMDNLFAAAGGWPRLQTVALPAEGQSTCHVG